MIRYLWPLATKGEAILNQGKITPTLKVHSCQASPKLVCEWSRLIISKIRIHILNEKNRSSNRNEKTALYAFD